MNNREFSEWVEMKNLWLKTKIAKLDMLQKENMQKLLENEECYFTPKINKTSLILANVKNFNENKGLLTHEKLYNHHKEKQLKIQEKIKSITPSFIPKINRNKPSFLKSSTLSHTRLYVYEENLEEEKNYHTHSGIRNKSLNNSISGLKSKYSSHSISGLKSKNSSRKLRSENISTETSFNRKIKLPSLASPSVEGVSDYKSVLDSLYKINVRNCTAWNSPINTVKTTHSNYNLFKSLPTGKV